MNLSGVGLHVKRFPNGYGIKLELGNGLISTSEIVACTLPAMGLEIHYTDWLQNCFTRWQFFYSLQQINCAVDQRAALRIYKLKRLFSMQYVLSVLGVPF